MRSLLGLCLLAPPLAAQVSSCPPLGLELEAEGGLLGQPYAIELEGTPHAPGSLGVDTGGGPLPLAFGTLCLDLSPALFLLPIALDVDGRFALGGNVPNSPALLGQTSFLQAVLVDLGQPGSLAISNGATLRYVPPRIHMVSRGQGTLPTQIGHFDVSTGAISIVATPGPDLRDVVRLPQANWIVGLDATESIVAFDEESGQEMVSVPLPDAPGVYREIAALGADRILALSQGQEVGGFLSDPGTLQEVSLVTGSIETTIPLAAANHEEMLVAEDGERAYIADSGFGVTSVIVVDLVAGAEIAEVDVGLDAVHGRISGMEILDGRLFVLMAGYWSPFGGNMDGAINAIDLATNTALFPSPVLLPMQSLSPARVLRVGPGASGDALFVLAGAASRVFEIDPATLTLKSTVLVPPGTEYMELSHGRTEWLLLRPGDQGGTPARLATLSVPGLALTQHGAQAGFDQGALLVHPRAGVNTAWIQTEIGRLIPFPTDPTSPPAGGSIPTPFANAPTEHFAN